jgi:hypothetical protein
MKWLSGSHESTFLAEVGRSWSTWNPSHGVSWVLGPTKHAQDVFDMCGLEELQIAVFHERDVSSGELDLE